MENPSCSAWKRKKYSAYHPSIIVSNLFFLLLFSSFFSPSEQLFGACTASWSDWGAWTSCPVVTVIDPTVVARRTRTCTQAGLFCTPAPCEGESGQTLVCGTTTTKETYSTIVFGTTMFDETTTVGDVTTTELTTTVEATTTEATTKDATTAEATTEDTVTTKSSETTTEGSATTAAATTKESDTVTTTEGSVTDATTVKSQETTTEGDSTNGGSDQTTIDFTFPSNAPGGEDTTILVEESTAPFDECAPPVTTVSTMAPGTLGTLFPGGGGGGGGLDPFTFPTTPPAMPGVTRSPACKTTPILTTTISFKTCTMIAVSTTTPMISTTTEMESTTTSSAVSTTLESVSTTLESISTTESSETTSSPSVSSTEAVSETSTQSQGSSSESVSSDAPSVTTPESGSSTENVSSESPVSSTQQSASSSESISSESPSETTEPSASSGGSSESPISTSEASISSEAPSVSSEEPSASSESPISTSEPSASSEDPSASSEEPSASSENPNASSDSVSTDSPSVTTEDSIGSTNGAVSSDGTTPNVEVTTEYTWSTCSGCAQLNVKLSNGNPYEDASSVLNRYAVAGCDYVSFFCRPMEIGDTTPVSTILSGDYSYLSAPLSASLACRDKKWVFLGSTNPLASSVTSLGCVYAIATTTKPKTTTIPGIDPNNPCMNCTNLVVSQSIYPEGVTYLDHTLNTCLSVQAHCLPINGGTEVQLMYNNKNILVSGATVNRTFTCTKNSKWLDVSTNNIISNISCIMPKVVTTTPIVASTLHEIPSTDAGSPTKDSSNKPVTEPKTTPDAEPPEALQSTTQMDITTVENMPSTPPAGPNTPDVTDIVIDSTTTTLPSVCNNCVPLEPLSRLGPGKYNGMLVLWHYRQNGCNRVSISCQATISESDVAYLYYNPNGEVMSGTGELAMDLVCTNGNYVYQGKTISTVSCLASTSAVIPITTLPPITTPAPGDDCSGCNRLPVDILSVSSGYTNGLLKATTSYSNCMSVQLTCYGVSSTDQASLIYADSPLATSIANANLTLTCNTAGMWVTDSLQTVESISCGYVSETVTTTALPSSCGICSNMESAQALLQTDSYDGMIVLYNYVDPVSKCKKVDISCQGTTSTENTDLIFNPIGTVSSGPGIHEISLNCSSDGKWKYTGSVIESVSCIISTGVATLPTTVAVLTTSTTLNPSIPLCAQCSRLSAGAVSSIDDSLQNGITTMTFSTVNSCSSVHVTCSGITSSERVTLLAATTSLISGIGSVSFNFTCNSAADWMTAAGTIVDSVSCGRYNLTTSTTSTTTPTTATTTRTSTVPLTTVSQCSKCANMLAKAMNPTDGSYDGMIILNHYTSGGCRRLDVSCGPTLNTENATIIFGSTVVATGAAIHSFSLTCDSNANWIYESTSVSTVSCLISTAANGVTAAPTTIGTTVKDDGASACSQCGKAPIVSVGAGSTYLNGFSTVVQSTDAQGCSLLYIRCQGMTTADAVALLSSGMPYSSGFGSVTANLTCNSQSQWTGRSSTAITSLACGHKNAATTRSSITTLAPVGRCTSCENMVAVSMAATRPNSYDGMVIMDHFINPSTNCRAVTITCAPTVSTENATLYFNSDPISTGMASHNFELTCDSDGSWEYETTIVNNVGCLISTGTGVATTVTTIAPVTNPSNNLCSQCTRIPIQSVGSEDPYRNGFVTLTTTINTFGCTITTMMCQGVTSADPVAIVINGIYAEYSTGSATYNDFSCNSQGEWTSSGFGIVSSVICQRTVSNEVVTTRPATTTTTTSNALCNSCSDIRPRTMGTGDPYDGMIVITQYKDRSTSCRKATIDCMTTMDYETAELYLDSNRISSSGMVEVDVECSNEGVWMYNGEEYSTTSCLVSNSTSSSGKKRKKRQAGNGLTACQSCGAVPMTSLYSFYPYMNGFSTISVDDSSSCMTAVAACEGVTSTDTVAWIASGTILSSGTNIVNMTFTCNSLSSWQTSSGSVFSSLSCGRRYATTTVATTTVASQALNCPNLIAAPLTPSELGPNESNGQLILDHFIDTTAMAREVTITCYGSSATDNTTISFNGGSRTMSGTGQIQLTMTCSSTGQWMRNGIGVETVACIVVTPPGSTVPITTAIPTTPTTSAGSLPSTNCARNVMLTIPSGYNAGYLSMNTISTETSLQVVMSCAAPTGITESMLLSSTGAISTSGSPTINMTMTCNSASQWVVSSASGTGIPIGTVITSIACVVAASPTTTLVPATIPSGCQLCSNLPAIGLDSSQLDANERNGQFILDHVTTPTACRVVYLSCAGSSASENSTILFNGGSQTMSNQGITSTVLTCTSSSTWDWYGSSVGYASCKVADRALATTTAPLSLTTTAYVVPGETGLACNRSDLVNPLIEGEAGAYLVLDTIIVNGGLSTTLSCAAPDASSTAVLTNGDGSVLGQSSNGLINMTLTCNSNSQWVVSAISASTSGTSAALGTVVDDLKCGEIAAPTTTIATTTTPSGACQQCPNMQAIALTSSQLIVNGATNGQLLLSHSVDQSSKCRIVVIKCRGENTNQNATIFFNANGQSLSAMYGQVATSMACSPSNTWQRNGVEIDGVACMITSVVGATSTSPAPITTVAPSSTTQSSSGPSASCNTGFTTAVSTPGYTAGFMTVDTKTSGSLMTADITCASPVTSQTAALLDSNNNQVSYGVGTTFMTLTCNSNSQWVTPTGVTITTLSCGTVAPATTTTLAPTTTTTPIATTRAAAADCSIAAWNAWQEWSSCTDTCGSCGTQQRFRSCNKPLDTCTCPGSAYEKEYCNLAVCKFPRDSCCTGFTPHSSGGTFVCLDPST
uniref:C6 domain-containing protein n=1 Tax=Caenorhabditis tropicalis TaxID=1561998 RepID=A0A1I7V4R0_9PELO